MSLELIGFIILSAGVLASGAVVVIARNPIHSAIALIVSFFFLAGLYLTLNANFVAIIQVLLYAGAIMVLFMFVIMLLNLSDDELGEARWNFHKVLGTLAALAVAGVLIWAIVNAQTRYLDEPAMMRNQNIERLRKTANLYPFTNPGERQAYFSKVGRLRVMATQKLRLEHGTEDARVDACAQVAAAAPSLQLPPGGCETRDGQLAARSVAAAEIGDFDSQLVALEAEVDPSAVPAAWRGDAAERIPGTEPSRAERAVLAVVDIAFAIQIERLIEREAIRILEPEQLSALDAYAAADTKAVGEDLSAREMRGAGLQSPGGRIQSALQKIEAVERMAEDNDVRSARLARFEDTADTLVRAYEQTVNRVLTDWRNDDRAAVVRTLVTIQGAVGETMTDTERQFTRNIINDLSRGGPPSLELMVRPAIYDEDEFGSVEAVGRDLLTRWLLPFEVTAVLLLVGILGATVIAKRRT